MTRCVLKIAMYVQFVTGCVFILLFTILAIFWSTLYFSILKDKLILTDSSFSFDLWKETPFPMYLELFLYNFTNSDDVMNAPKNTTIKPIFEENGPYVFRENQKKVNITWHDNGTVTYFQKRTWYFEPDLSNGNLDDKITNINVIAFSAAYSVRNDPLSMRLTVNGLLKTFTKNRVQTKTARELLFDGYSDAFLDLANSMNMSIPYDKFGWFYDRNNSDTFDGEFLMHTGTNDITKLGDIELWNKNENINFYDGECDLVKGTTAQLFPPRNFIDNFNLFSSDMCSLMSFHRVKDVQVQGIDGVLFTADRSFDNGANFTEEGCFCPKNSVCQPPGTRNVSLCRLGAPAFISFPHFYNADPEYLSKIEGLVPNEENDKFEIVMELRNGVPLLVNAQLQINILGQKIPNMDYFKDLPDDLYYPMLWFRQRVEMPEDMAEQIKLALTIEKSMPIFFYVMIGLGGILFISSGIILLCR